MNKEVRIGITIQHKRSSSATQLQMDQHQLPGVSGPRLSTQISIKDRSPPTRPGRPELCLHTIPFVILLCFLLLWIVSSEVDSQDTDVKTMVSSIIKNANVATRVKSDQ